MAQLALIIGNGFDLDLGLPTRYTDFVGSKEWNALYKGFDRFLLMSDYKDHSLLSHLKEAAYNKENWFDIELELYNFVKAHPNCSDTEVRDIRAEFDALKKSLAEYIKSVATSKYLNSNSVGQTFMHHLSNCMLTKFFIYFNYTSCCGLTVGRFHPQNAQAQYVDVHGSIADPKSIVLGCDLQEGDSVNRSLSFMYKYNMINQTNHIVRAMSDTQEVIFYGHSLNEMDFGYFRQLFEQASRVPHPSRYFTFITYDEESERCIKDNIRNQGINVTDLYTNQLGFTFLHTSKYYNEDPKELDMWYKFFDRLQSYVSE